MTRALSASNGDRKVGNIEARIKYKSSHIFVPFPFPLPDWRCELEYEEEEEGVLQPTKNSLFVSWSSPCRIHLEGKERKKWKEIESWEGNYYYKVVKSNTVHKIKEIK